MTCPRCRRPLEGDGEACPGCGAPLVVGRLVFPAGERPPVVLTPRSYTLGRALENDITVLQTSVSRRHARLAWEGERFVLEDLGSRQGTHVDGRSVTRAPVPFGTEGRLGEVGFRLEALPAGVTPDESDTTQPVTERPRPEADTNLKLLFSVVETVNSTLVLTEVLERTVDAIMAITGADRGFVLLGDNDGPADEPRIEGMQIRVARGNPAAAPLSTTILRKVRDTLETVASGNAVADPRIPSSESVVGMSMRTVVCIPLQSPRRQGAGALLGVLYADNHDLAQPFSRERLGAAEALARHAALAIENARLFEQEEQRVRELSKARDEALAASRAKTAFLANMNHELHTPLNAIIGYAEMALDRAVDLGDQDLASDIRKIRSSGKGLLRLIDDILDLSRLQDGPVPLRLEDVDVATLAAELGEKGRGLAARQHNGFDVEVDPGVGSAFVDGRRLRQAVLALLANAAKFTEHGRIRLAVAREEKEERAWVRFDVEDTGIGMTPEQMAIAFEPFSLTGDPLTRRHGGAGLGLPLTRKLCEAMGGSVAVTSHPGSGSTFTLRVPAQVATDLAS